MADKKAETVSYFQFLRKNWKSIVSKYCSNTSTEKEGQELVWSEFIKSNTKKVKKKKAKPKKEIIIINMFISHSLQVYNDLNE